MKFLKILLPIFLITLMSCKSEQEKLILDREQTMGKTKIDLHMSVKSMQYVGSITGLDSSILVIQESYSDVNSVEELISNRDSSLDIIKVYEDNMLVLNKSYSDYENYDSQIKLNFDKIFRKRKGRSYTSIYNSHKDVIESAISEYDSHILKLNSTIDQHNHYVEIGDVVLVNKWKAVYTIQNPMLNNVKQTIEKTYYLSPNNNSIIGSE